MKRSGLLLFCVMIIGPATVCNPAWAAVIANYGSDFLGGTFDGQTRVDRQADGWDYMWNANAAIGTAAGNYASLKWRSANGHYNFDGLGGLPRANPAAWANLNAGGGHPGRGVNQGAGVDRYAIAAYEVQPGEDGLVQILGSNLGVGSGGSNGVELRVYVNDSLVRNLIRTGGASGGFDTVLGVLDPGDRVYVAMGPNQTDGNDGFSLAYRLETSSDATIAAWDPNGAAPGSGGSGTWNTNTANTPWALSTGYGAWGNAANRNAYFGGSAGTVTVAEPVTARSMTFYSDGYSLTGAGAITLTNAGSGGPAGAAVDVANAGATTTIAVPITSSVPMTKLGDGTLVLQGANSVTGNLNAYGGNLVLRGSSTNTVSGRVSVGGTSVAGGTVGALSIQDSASLTAAQMMLGDSNGYAGTIHQSGGSVTVTGGTDTFRIGHWPNETSTYNLSGGTLNITGTTAIRLGWDGNGAMNVSGTGTLQAAGRTITLGRNGNGTLNATGGTINAHTISIAAGGSGNVVNISGTAAVNLHNFFLGQTSGRSGEVNQSGGTVSVNGQLRVGHWPNQTSTYTMSDGSLTLTGSPGSNPFTSGGTEQNGTLYIGVDGTGVFTQTGGTVSAAAMVLDNRGNTAGTDTYTLNGGSLILGSWGIQGNPSTQVNLGGGTVSASASWGSTRPMTLTGTGGLTTFDPAGNTITLYGPLDGPGGLIKAGAGTLVLSGSNAYTGETRLGGGTLTVSGSGALTQTAVLRNTGGGAVFNIEGSASVVVRDRMVFGDAGGGTAITINQSGGSVTSQGTTDNPAGNNLSNRWGHWGGGTTVYNLTGGTLSLLGAPLYLSWDGAATLNIGGGTANILGINMGYGGRNQASTINLTSGRLNIGGAGIVSGGTSNKSINLGGGALGAVADWSSSRPMTLTGTGGNATVDSDGNDITLSGGLSGNGGLNKVGDGTLRLNGNQTYRGPTTVSGGTLSVDNGQLYNNFGWQNQTIAVTGGGVFEVGGWADGDSFGPGRVSFNAGNLIIDGGTVRYTGSTTSGNSDRGFTIGAAGATLEAAGGNTWHIQQNRPVFTINASSGGTLTLAGAGAGQLSMTLGGSGQVVKQGAGTWTIAGAHSYSGLTTVEAGTLLVDGSIPGSVAVEGGMLSGTGTIGGTVTVGSGGMHAPGASVGQQTAGGATWLPGGAFQFEINDATGTAGGPNGWDLLTIADGGSGTLDLSSLTDDSFTIEIVSLAGTEPGDIANFIATQPYEWEFLTYEQLGGTFIPSLFTIDATGFSNSLGAGHFSIVQTDAGLAVAFIPEPGTLLMGLIGLLLLLSRRRRG